MLMALCFEPSRFFLKGEVSQVWNEEWIGVKLVMVSNILRNHSAWGTLILDMLKTKIAN